MKTLSIVMSVKDDADYLEATLHSIGTLAPRESEVLVVDDGSSDHTARILAGFARTDERVRITTSAAKGLTAALIEGCSRAKGSFIARHDGGGDISLGDRFTRQLKALNDNASTVLVAGGTRFVGPCREHLYDVIQDTQVLQANLCNLESPRGPSHHGCTMFRRDAYQRSGGYRREFRVAQDLDLWVRLSEIGDCLAIPEVLYQAQLNRASLSALYRQQQVKLSALVGACARQRRQGRDECDLLREIEKVSCPATLPATRLWEPRLSDAKFYYFIGSCLADTHPKAARHYFKTAIRAFPLHFGTLYKLGKLTLNT